MIPVTRISDLTFGLGGFTHLLGIPYPVLGVHITGSITKIDGIPYSVIANGMPITRLGDISIHTCPFCPINMNISGSPNVITNGLPTVRMGDIVTEFCGFGFNITGSPNVFVN